MTQSRISRGLILAGVILLCIASALGVKKGDNGKLRTKARYYYLKGAEKEADGKIDEAFEYFKKAYKTDPSYTDASYAYGLSRSALLSDTFSSREEFLYDLALMRPLLDQYPSDISSAERYAYAAALADTLPEGIRVYNILVREHPGLSRIYMPLSFYYLNIGEVDSAVHAIREFERLEGATTETTIRKVTALLSVKDTASALEEARRYAEANPGQPEPIIDKAMIYSVLGQQDSAILFLEDALRQFPDRSETKFDIAMLYAEKGDSSKFHKLVDEAFRGEDMEYEDRMAMLQMYTKNLPFGADDYSESDRLYEYASTLYGNDADFYDQYANYELTKASYSGALEKAGKALELNPTEPSFLGRVISLSIVADKPREGMSAFEKFPSDDLKKQYGILMAYISAAQLAGEYLKSLEWIDTLINVETPGLSLNTVLTLEKMDSVTSEYDPDGMLNSSVAYEVAGDIFAKLKDSGSTVRSYENSILLADSTDASSLNNYAYYLVETLKVKPGSDEFEKAKRMSRMSLEKSPEQQAVYLDTYAWILYNEGDYKNAILYQEMAIETEGKNVASEMLSHYGDMLYMDGRKEEALEQWEKALKLEPDDLILQKKVAEKTLVTE